MKLFSPLALSAALLTFVLTNSVCALRSSTAKAEAGAAVREQLAEENAALRSENRRLEELLRQVTAQNIDKANTAPSDEAIQTDPLTDHEGREEEKPQRRKEQGGTGAPEWNIDDLEGGSDKFTRWRSDKGGGMFSWLMAAVFVCFIGSLPLALQHGADGAVTRTHIVEMVCLYIWLIGGLYLFTQVIIFQSPHFAEPRPLSLEEAVYLFSQILTTVGYGDITPAKTRGQVFVGAFVVISIMLIANMVTELVGVFMERMEKILEAQGLAHLTDTEKIDDGWLKVQAAFKPVIYSLSVFMVFVLMGTLFFHFYPGENKTLGQGVYMSLITLSTVGFGAFTPTTHGGMVFGAFWMLFGVGALGSVITSYTSFSVALKQYEGHRIRHSTLMKYPKKGFQNKMKPNDQQEVLRGSA